ncbi:MAG: OmpA/MotB family protein [Planctomycetota bacterium]
MKFLKLGLISVAVMSAMTFAGCMSPDVEEAINQKDQIITSQDKEISRLTNLNHQMLNERGMAIKERDEVAERLEAANELLAKSKNDAPSDQVPFRPREDGSISVTVLDDVLFASGKYELHRSEAHTTLAKIAAAIARDYPDYMIRVEGYTDSDPVSKSKVPGVMEDNMDLSYRRAKSVYEDLIHDHLSDRMMTIACYADTAPKGTKSESRRVEIVVLPKLKVVRSADSTAMAQHHHHTDVADRK